MIEDTLAKLEDRLARLSSVSEEKRAELQALFDTLKDEVVQLAESEDEHAESITRFAELSAYESTRASRDEALQQLSIDGLRRSVKRFETSHPKLVQIVNAICLQLSHLGI